MSLLKTKINIYQNFSLKNYIILIQIKLHKSLSVEHDKFWHIIYHKKINIKKTWMRKIYPI